MDLVESLKPKEHFYLPDDKFAVEKASQQGMFNAKPGKKTRDHGKRCSCTTSSS
jgi:hypothetical protein